MIQIRKAIDRGHTDYGWLSTHHTFSFASYRDSQYMGFQALRVLNEDRVQPGEGFDAHDHRNMEIISYVLAGSLAHKDSMGNTEILNSGELQRISAGSGITHSEFNPSEVEVTHFYQIWLFPSQRDLSPSYEQREFSVQARRGRLQLVASPDGRDDSLLIHSNANLFLSQLSDSESIIEELNPGRNGWVQVLYGNITVNGQELSTSDGAAITNERQLTIEARKNAEIMFFDLA